MNEYQYQITDEQGRTVAEGTCSGHDQHEAGNLVFAKLPGEAIMLSTDYDRQEQGAWLYSVNWTTPDMSEDESICWDIRIW